MGRRKQRIFFKRRRGRSLVVVATAVVAAIAVTYATDLQRWIDFGDDSLPRCDSDVAQLTLLATLKRTVSMGSGLMKVDDLHEKGDDLPATGRDTRHCVAEVRIGTEERIVQFTMESDGGEDGFSIRLTGT